jgi:uncharacterized repeat protein (TIGR02543 family)
MRRLATVVTTLALSVSGMVFSPAQANVPVDGDYNCAGGVKDGAGTKYTITNGVVSSGISCTGAVVISAGATGIAARAFNGATLTSITIPSSVTSIGLRAFQGTSALTSITIPSSVTTINEYAFNNAGLTSITIPASVTSFGVNIFENSQLTTAEFAPGSSLTGIPSFLFAQAYKLTSITIPEAFTTIGNSAFANTAITSITIPANVTSIGDFAFSNSGLTAITFASGSKLASIGEQAFVGNLGLTSITIPASVTTIGVSAFSNSQYFAAPGTLSLTAIDVAPANPNYRSIDGVLFNKDATTLIQYPSRKSNTTYSIPVGVTSIGKEAFSRATNLTSVTIPAGVATIGEATFRGTTALTSVNIPASVTSIGNNAFVGASTLADVTFTGNAAPTIGSGAFTGVASSAKACVKTGATGFTTSGSPARWNGIGVNDGAYMASFNTNGGSTVAAVSFITNGQIAAPAEPTKAGHTFAGWTATDGGSTIVTFPHTPSATCGTTLHAKWDLIPVVNEPAPLVNNPAPAAAPTSTAQPATTNVVSAKANYTAKSLATQVGVTTVSPKATVTISVAKSSKKFCTKSGSKLKTLKAGSCVVTITVQEPKPKGGKKPKATKTTKTLVVS